MDKFHQKYQNQRMQSNLLKLFWQSITNHQEKKQFKMKNLLKNYFQKVQQNKSTKRSAVNKINFILK